MLEILKKLEEGGGDEVEGGEGTRSLEERLAGLDLENTELVWEQLTLSEKNEFQELVKSGRMGHLLSVYTPWWEVRCVGSGCEETCVHVHSALVGKDMCEGGRV